MRHSLKNYIINLIFPAVVFGMISGVATAITVVIYKFCANHIIALSSTCYSFLRTHIFMVPVAVIVLSVIAWFLAFIYKKMPELCGGGIPASIGILRGVLNFKWLGNLIGTFSLSLMSFFIGVPLGNEGPSVQMGTALGRAAVRPFYKKHGAWDRYSMTGGACAGFSVATGAPVSGIMFAVEEAHQRVSPMIIIVAFTSVVFSRITSELLSPVFNVNVRLFPEIDLISLPLSKIYIPFAVGLAMGLFAVVFLLYYRCIKNFFGNILKKVSLYVKILSVLLLTLIFGLISESFVSTGHHLMLSLFEERPAFILLLVILAVRSSLTLFANSNGITGGIFVPLLTLGAVFSAMMSVAAEDFFCIKNEYCVLILVLGITACISSLMKMPLTAVMFSLEALSCYENLLSVVIVVAVSYTVTEIFEAKSINDSVLESKTEKLFNSENFKVIDTFVTVKEGSFAVGKQIRDILWPPNLFVLSFKSDEQNSAQIDVHGGYVINSGDILHIRYSAYDETLVKNELMAIVGEQNYIEQPADTV